MKVIVIVVLIAAVVVLAFAAAVMVANDLRADYERECHEKGGIVVEGYGISSQKTIACKVRPST